MGLFSIASSDFLLGLIVPNNAKCMGCVMFLLVVGDPDFLCFSDGLVFHRFPDVSDGIACSRQGELYGLRNVLLVLRDPDLPVLSDGLVVQ